MFEAREALLDPGDRPALAREHQRGPERKTARRARVGRRLGVNFMQVRARKPAAERRVKRGRAERSTERSLVRAETRPIQAVDFLTQFGEA